MEKFLKAHGALYEQKAHRLFFFFLLEGWNRWWWMFFLLMKNTCSFKEKNENTQMFEVDGCCPRNKDEFDRFVQDEFEGWQ